MKRIAYLVLVACSAMNAHAANLLDIYRDALVSDSQFNSARAQLESGKEKGPQGTANILPVLNMTGASSYTRTDVELVSNPVNFGFNTNSYQVQLTQPLFRWQNWVSYKQGDLQVGLAQAQFQTARNDLALRAAQTYFDVLYAEEVLASVQALKSAADQQLQLSKKSFQVGTVTITDVNEAQSKYDLASAQEIAAQSDLIVKREALSLLSGKPPQTLARLRPGVQITAPIPASMEDWVGSAEKNNPAVQAQQLALEIAKRDVEKARAGHLPTVDMVASYSNVHLTNTNNGNPSLVRNGAVGVQLQLPLYAGGATQSKVRESLALSTKAESDLETQRRTAVQAARQAFVGVTSGIAQVRGYEAAVLSSKSAVDSNKLGYEVGVRINIDVLNAQSSLADTQQKLAKARYDTLIAQLKLKAATGTIEAEDMAQINALLVP
ncbi:TolC family outer membrane protein [Uliginosibacterium sp. H3]|uniref:TolC family outer membrane protein n=1 Tax=Uliginosibacterium silvisoli TaxID=3114758 RepID=A0ABU6K0W5_9RHOO|nr:TolC family outer membrane protein [Uliginosibacterium sp. H3]